MRFAFTQDQLDLRAAVRQVLDAECTSEDVRRAVGEPGAPPVDPDRRRWAVLADLGAIGLLAAPPGGLGLGEVELVVVLEEAGWAGLPEPLMENAGLVVPLLTRAQAAGLDRGGELGSWLEGLTSGELIGTVGGLEITTEGWAITTEGTRAGTARTPRVPAATTSQLVALTHQGTKGPAVHLVEAGSRRVEPTPSLDPTRDLGEVEWEPGPGSLLAQGPAAVKLLADLADRGALASAAVLLGVADRLIAISADYARERRQFGAPIGSFQAVKHLLANVRVRLEFARPALYRAAWSIATAQSSAHHDASMAKALASDTAELAARTAIQVHGAIGYTWECDVQLWAKRVWALAGSWGDARTQRALVLTAALRARATGGQGSGAAPSKAAT